MTNPLVIINHPTPLVVCKKTTCRWSIQRSQDQGILWWTWSEVDNNGSLPRVLLLDHFLGNVDFLLIGWQALPPRKCGEMFDIFFQLKNQKQTIGRGGTFRTIFTYEYIYIYLRIAKTNQPLNGFMDIYPENGSNRMAFHGPFVGCCGWGGKLTGRHLRPKKNI